MEGQVASYELRVRKDEWQIIVGRDRAKDAIDSWATR